jgi:serine/threonine protein kinase
MGVVYLGHHEALDRRVVIKVLQPELCDDADMVQRFFNEARAATAIRSPGIVQAFDFDVTSDQRAYFVMELLEGESLAARLSRLRHRQARRRGPVRGHTDAHGPGDGHSLLHVAGAVPQRQHRRRALRHLLARLRVPWSRHRCRSQPRSQGRW